ncbi:hypothetical protein PAXRUDRAFT_835111 [Paxillus rubicundulus Ve08.2h10]|uniref:Uncharacterized protein n=1 Tax=Paxillus rubicundulus Ve08.2h10 TaxID=930991 RepID=A0A0D0DGP0_9AGAM|nr:hypothetical protein PAXRUDRAFT_835111 [Paxillus rubicundulus Ve08.2h10]
MRPPTSTNMQFNPLNDAPSHPVVEAQSFAGLHGGAGHYGTLEPMHWEHGASGMYNKANPNIH